VCGLFHTRCSVAVCICVSQIGSKGLQSHVHDRLSDHLQIVMHRLAFLESQLAMRPAGPLSTSADDSVLTWIARLEQQLMDLQSSVTHGHKVRIFSV